MKATGSQNDSSLYSQYTEMIDNSYKGKSKTEKKHSWIQRQDQHLLGLGTEEKLQSGVKQMMCWVLSPKACGANQDFSSRGLSAIKVL